MLKAWYVDEPIQRATQLPLPYIFSNRQAVDSRTDDIGHYMRSYRVGLDDIY